MIGYCIMDIFEDEKKWFKKIRNCFLVFYRCNKMRGEWLFVEYG